jgi:hypothetical protein
MRISAYARATNPKYANFAVDWSQLAGQLGTKARGALSTSGGAAKLGAGIGAGIGAINYLGSEDKSIGNLAGQVAGGAALGGAAGYGGSKLKNAWQARKAGQVPPAQNTNSEIVLASGNQSGNSAPQNPINTKITGAAESEKQKMSGLDKSGRPNPSVPIQNTNGNIQGAQSQSKIKRRSSTQANLLKEKGVVSPNQLSPEDYQKYLDMSKYNSPFANFKVRRYNGFVY